MACVNCFFSTMNQRKLKLLTFKHDRFENRLKEYKKIYIDELKTLVPADICSCGLTYSASENYMEFTNNFLSFLKSNILIINEIFDVISKIYGYFITKSYKHAADLFWNTVNIFDLVGRSENPITYSNLLFRARKKGGYALNDYFHVPFDKRELVVNNRFSIAGQPMLYLGNSLYTVKKELNMSVDDLSIAAFLPKYSAYYGLKINDACNNIFNLLTNSLPGLFNAGGKIAFDDKSYVLKIRRSILCELLTFPCKVKGTFVEEYVLPQLFTSLLIENNYKGLIFPSTKDFSELTNFHRFSRYNNNIAFFVDYDEVENYDQRLFESFHLFTLDGSEKFKYTTNDILGKFDSVTDLHKKHNEHVNNNDFIIPLVNTKLYMEYLELSKINGIDYFETREGKIELE